MRIDNNMTAVEWLEERWTTQGTLHSSDLSQAKEMEKQQIIDAHITGYIIGGGNGDSLYDCKEYYNKTFKSE